MHAMARKEIRRTTCDDKWISDVTLVRRDSAEDECANIVKAGIARGLCGA